MGYVEEIMDAVMKISQGDFSARIDIRGMDDTLDTIANGVNMLAEELKALIDQHDTYEAVLNSKINDLKCTVEFAQETEIRMIHLKKEVDELRKQLNLHPKYF
jgi:methyl-accepting chemotaxis protein